ncbi:MAG: LPS translocon maturation chaperone LptM [Fimbriiglobus sp.]
MRTLLLLAILLTAVGCSQKADNTPNPELGPPPEHKSEGRSMPGKK